MGDPYADFPDEAPVEERGELVEWFALAVALPFGVAAFALSLAFRAVDVVRGRVRSWPLRHAVRDVTLGCEPNDVIDERLRGKR